MVTWRLLGLVGAMGTLGVVGCSGGLFKSSDGNPSGSAHGEEEGGEAGRGTAIPPGTVDPGGTGPQYPGTGFRVHEWGTNTIVVGSDGSMQRGLHHEEEDLPTFVYDRTKKEVRQSAVEVKMETPVAYFYSDKPLKASVNVRFPAGVLTQWYPGVTQMYPIAFTNRGDPVFDKTFPFSAPECRVEYQDHIANGMLDWGEIEVLARNEAPTNAPDAPLQKYTWSHARDVAANAIRVTPMDLSVAPYQKMAPQDERFLFYRGLGNFPIDVMVTAADGAAGNDGGLVVRNTDAVNAAGAIFVLRVEKEKAAFTVHASGIVPSGSLTETAPPATIPLDTYAQDLAKAMVTELDKAGLYHDESVAMVKTWARQWFRTPGVRVLYLAPQKWTDSQIPLSISPSPEELVRVMVIRVEAITRIEERSDLDALMQLDSTDAATRDAGNTHFNALGRFAEPRLRRAIQVAGSGRTGKNAFAYLYKISGINTTAQAGE